MINIENIDDFPKLTPDKSISFEAKDTIRRSPEMNFECSEQEYKRIVAAEEDLDIKLRPDINIMMPDKKSLKHKTVIPYLRWTSIAATAAILAFILFITKDKPSDSTVIATKSKPETNTIVETRPKPMIISDKTSENKTSAKNADVKTATIRKSSSKPVETGTVEQETPVESSGNQDNVPRRKDAGIERIEPIAIAFVPVEMMNKPKTVFVYQYDYREPLAFKAINNVASAVEKLSDDVNDTKQNISQKLDEFRLLKIFGRLNIDQGIDRKIDEWAKNNPDIPFDVFIDYTAENKMKEIYDENGTLVKVVFFTDKSLKYKSNKKYQALNY
jgi:hypothetical protein